MSCIRLRCSEVVSTVIRFEQNYSLGEHKNHILQPQVSRYRFSVCYLNMYANNITAFAQIRLENVYILVCLHLAWIHDCFYLSISMNRKYKIHRINFLYF